MTSCRSVLSRVTLTGACSLALAAALFLAAGCTERATSSDSQVGGPVTPRRGGEFHIMSERPSTLDPSAVDDVYEACVVNQLYDGLLEFDPNLHPVPAIAREWKVSRDGRVYTFQLRDDVRFHNGRPVVAEDFVYSFSRVFEPSREDHGIGGGYLCKIQGMEAYASGEASSVAGLEVLAEDTLRITLERPYASFLAALAMDQTKVVAREEVERWGDEYGLHPVGTGPFVLAEPLAPGDSLIRLEANPDYYRERAYVDRLVFHTPRNYTTDKAAETMLAGGLTMCDLRGALKDAFEADTRFKIIRRPELSFSFLGLNVDLTPLQDVRVRRAIAHAIDRERIAAVDPAARVQAQGILPPGMFGYSPDLKALPYDPEAAKRLLAEAGYPGGEGLPPVQAIQADGGEVGRRADALMKQDLAAVGITLDFRYVDWEVFDPLLMGREIPAFNLTWVADVPDPDSFLASLFSSTGSLNLFNYENETVDSLLGVGCEMRGSVERSAVYRQAERLILEDVAVIPMFHIANNFAVRSELRGLVVPPSGLGNLQLERVWIDSPAS